MSGYPGPDPKWWVITVFVLGVLVMVALLTLSPSSH